ncbi:MULTISPECIES: hypothetical protein [Bacteroides]|nr:MULTISPECIES: hypothetical protein [Bacteroides]
MPKCHNFLLFVTFPAGRSAPLREADGEADRRKSPAVTGMIRKV